MHKIIVFLVCFLFTITTFGQSQNLKNCEINFRVENYTYGKQFFVTVGRDQKNILIEYKIKVKERYKKREKDAKAIKLRQELLKNIKNLSPENDSLLKLQYALDSIYIFYTVFRIESLKIEIDSFPEYDKIIDKLFLTSTDSLEKGESIFLHPTHFKFILKMDENSRTVYANTVSEDNYPQLAEFVRETMALYRKRKNNNFLDKESTAGY